MSDTGQSTANQWPIMHVFVSGFIDLNRSAEILKVAISDKMGQKERGLQFCNPRRVIPLGSVDAEITKISDVLHELANQWPITL